MEKGVLITFVINLKKMLRTHTCGELTKTQLNQEVTLVVGSKK